MMETTAEFDDENMDFYGFYEHEIPQEKPLFPDFSSEFPDLDLSAPFPPDMNNCSGWYDGILPDYEVKFSGIPEDSSEVRKVKPLKIKKALLSSPNPPTLTIQRESREWKPSSQFFKPLTAGNYLKNIISYFCFCREVLQRRSAPDVCRSS